MDANKPLTDLEPNDQDGQPDGTGTGTGQPSSTAPDGLGHEFSGSASDPIEAQASETSMPLATLDAALASHLAGEPGTLPVTWCKKCQADVRPVDKGVCPRCRTFLRLNFSARKHPVNKLRKEQLIDTFVGDYKPSSPFLRGLCEDLAGIREQLDHLKPGSTEWARLVERQQSIGAQLEASRPSSPAHEDVDAMSLDQLAAEAEKLAAQVREMSTPTPAPATPAFDASPIPAPPLVEQTTEPPAPAPEPAAAPDPRCAFCGGLASACETIRDDPFWMVEHRERHDVKAHLAAQAVQRHALGWDAGTRVVPQATIGSRGADDPTQEMFESLKRQRDGDPWIR